MELARIERYVSDLMTVSGVEMEGREQSVGLALYHLLMSAALRDLMDDDDKELFRLLTKKLQYFFCTRLSLKERKETKKKTKKKQKRKKQNRTPPPAKTFLKVSERSACAMSGNMARR